MSFYRCVQCNWSGDDFENLLVCIECSSNELLKDLESPHKQSDADVDAENESAEE